MTVDKNGANLAALQAINAERETPITIRQCKYLNNNVEQDHRAIKPIVKPMLGFKDFRCARIIVSGIELIHMIRKKQMRAKKTPSISRRAVLLANDVSNPNGIDQARPSTVIATEPHSPWGKGRIAHTDTSMHQYPDITQDSSQATQDTCGLRWKTSGSTASSADHGPSALPVPQGAHPANHIAGAVLVWVRLADIARNTKRTLYQVKHEMLDDFLSRELKNPSVPVRFA